MSDFLYLDSQEMYNLINNLSVLLLHQADKNISYGFTTDRTL